jgi:hypothetical protein
LINEREKSVVVFDIDGTLANINHRRVYLETDPPNWSKFNELMGDDTPNAPVVSLYMTLWISGRYELILASGRSERYRSITERWLTWNEIPFGRLVMRADGDYRADHRVKQDIHDRLISGGKSIVFVVDDRQQVVDMWRRNGVMCLQCDVGDF